LRTNRRYPTDLTDRQWALVEPCLPPPNPAGRPECHSRREVVNAILYVVRTGCSWRMLPKDFPPWQTVYWYFSAWRDEAVIDKINGALHAHARINKKVDARPSANASDSKPLRGAHTVGSPATR